MNLAALLGVHDLHATVVALAAGATMEITPHEAAAVSELASILAPGSTVYVAHTPRVSLGDVVAAALSLQAHGLSAAPHLVARRITSTEDLSEAIGRLEESGVRRVLAIAGDVPKASGPFHSTLDMLESPAFAQGPFPEVSVAAHPEGHPVLDDETLWAAILAKREFARRTGTVVTLLTQFGFDMAALTAWDRRLVERSVDLPVVVGIAGPTPLGKLLTYARHCGVSASLRGAIGRPSAFQLATGRAHSPGQVIVELAKRRDPRATRICGLHLFSFGGPLQTARWLRALTDGQFRVLPEQATLELLA